MLPKNRVFSSVFGGIILPLLWLVMLCFNRLSLVATNADWAAFGELAATDRSYFAFCLDSVILASHRSTLSFGPSDDE
jgi:hypothetical protein